jgi:hypothetical protein
MEYAVRTFYDADKLLILKKVCMQNITYNGQLNSAIAFFNVDQIPQVNGVATNSQNSITSANGVGFGGAVCFIVSSP